MQWEVKEWIRGEEGVKEGGGKKMQKMEEGNLEDERKRKGGR